MIHVYDEGIQYEPPSPDTDNGMFQKGSALRRLENHSSRINDRNENSMASRKKKTVGTPKPPENQRIARLLREKGQSDGVSESNETSERGLSDTKQSRVKPILSQIESDAIVMNPIIVLSVKDDERERIRAMSMCIEHHARCSSYSEVTGDHGVMAWVECIHDFAEGPMMMDMHEYAFRQMYKRMNKGALHALNRARGTIDKIYRFGGNGTSSSLAKTSFYLYQLVLCFTAVIHALNVEHGCARIDGESRDSLDGNDHHTGDKCKKKRMNEKQMRAIKDVMEDDTFHAVVATVCLEMCAFMHHGLGDDRFVDGFPVITNMVGHGGHMMEILIAVDWFIKAFHTSLATSQTQEDLSRTWLGRYSPSLAKEMMLPKIVLGYALVIRERILEQGIFEKESSWFTRSNQNDSDSIAVCGYCMRHLNVLLKARVALLVQNAVMTGLFSSTLEDQTGSPWEIKCTFINAMTDAVVKMLESLLSERLDIAFHQRITRIIVCAVYCTAKIIQCPLRLVQLELLCFSCFPLHNKDVDDLREYYNNIFLPSVHPFEESMLYGDTLSLLDEAYISLSSLKSS